MSDLQSRIATAMEKKRAELINRPLARIWDELALAAIQEFRTPNATTIAALAEVRQATRTYFAPVTWLWRKLHRLTP